MYKLMLIDDNYIQIQSLLNYIDKDAFNISEIRYSQNSLEAIEICCEFKPDIIITDISMPEMNGIELTKKLKSLNINAQFIYISCYDDVEYFKSAIDNEVIDYLMKPIIPFELKKAVSKSINKISKRSNKINELKILRENLIYRLLYSEELDIFSAQESASVLSLDKYKRFILVKSILLTESGLPINSYESIKNAEKLINDEKDLITIICDQSNIITLFMSENSDKRQFLKDVSNAIYRKTQQLSLEYGINIKSGISNVTDNLFELKKNLYQADYSLQLNLQLIHTEFMAYSEISTKTTEFDFVSYNKRIFEIITENLEIKIIDEFLSNLKKVIKNYDEKLIYEIYLSTLSVIHSISLDKNIDAVELVGRKEISVHKTSRFTDIGQFIIWLKNILVLIPKHLKNNTNNIQYTLVEKVIEHINTNFSTITSVEEIATNLYVSYSYLRKIFKKEMGVTVYDYLLSVRMKEAKKLLRSNNLNLNQIAHDLGYTDYDYFKTVFTKYYGISPLDFRKKNIEKSESRE